MGELHDAVEHQPERWRRTPKNTNQRQPTPYTTGMLHSVHRHRTPRACYTPYTDRTPTVHHGHARLRTPTVHHGMHASVHPVVHRQGAGTLRTLYHSVHCLTGTLPYTLWTFFILLLFVGWSPVGLEQREPARPRASPVLSCPMTPPPQPQGVPTHPTTDTDDHGHR